MPGKFGQRYYKSVGLGFRTPKTAIEGARATPNSTGPVLLQTTCRLQPCALSGSVLARLVAKCSRTAAADVMVLGLGTISASSALGGHA